MPCLTPDELSAFHAGELPETVLQEVANHLEGCPHCEAAARALDGQTDSVAAAYRKSALAAPPAEPASAPTQGISEGPPAAPATWRSAPAASGPLLLPRVGDHEILGELGRGGMGIVYKARHLKLNRVVALKMLLAGAVRRGAGPKRFRTEAEAVARLQHPHIVQLFEFGEHEGDGPPRPYFTMEFVEGGSLADRVAGRPQTPRQAAAWVEVLARAAHYAHGQGVVHRDLKPCNVLLTADGQPKICDFGVAKLLTGSDLKTLNGIVMGTAEYMAPEQASAGSVGPAADVYALGAILYECLTGRPPFRGTTPWETLEQVTGEEPVPPSRLNAGVPRDLETVCLKCLEKDPKKRYASAAALADDLERFLADLPVRALLLGRRERLWRWCRRNPLATSLLLAVTLGLAGGLWYLCAVSESLVRHAALEGAAQQAEIFDQIHDFYSAQVVARVHGGASEATPAYAERLRALPPPTTFAIELGEQISRHSPRGMKVRLYSDEPFRGRKGGGPRDDFEREALARLRQAPEQHFSRFESEGGRAVLRYATARVMGESCVHCHNTHPDSPRKNWKVGDVRGVLEIVRPLENDMARTRDGLRGTFLVTGGLGGGLLVLCSLVLILANRRHRPQAPRR
jgi:tRNA A-37 threonylcarbamoyl transferase component Bud32